MLKSLIEQGGIAMKKATKILIAATLSLAALSSIIYTEKNAKLNTTDVIDIRSTETSNVIFSEPMSFSEMVTHYAEATEISYDEALKLFPEESADSGASSTCHRILNIPLDVTAAYKPQLELYCETSESGHYWGLSNIYLVNMEKNHDSSSKQFSGDVDMWFRNGYELEYIVNGDFYNNGTMTMSDNTDLDFTEDNYVHISFTTSSSIMPVHYQYCYDHQTLTFQN